MQAVYTARIYHFFYLISLPVSKCKKSFLASGRGFAVGAVEPGPPFPVFPQDQDWRGDEDR
jgi:hypothetical protein